MGGGGGGERGDAPVGAEYGKCSTRQSPSLRGGASLSPQWASPTAVFVNSTGCGSWKSVKRACVVYIPPPPPLPPPRSGCMYFTAWAFVPRVHPPPRCGDVGALSVPPGGPPRGCAVGSVAVVGVGSGGPRRRGGGGAGAGAPSLCKGVGGRAGPHPLACTPALAGRRGRGSPTARGGQGGRALPSCARAQGEGISVATRPTK